MYRAQAIAFAFGTEGFAGFTYAGFALKDCVKGAGLPYVEVHISNIAKRGIHCVLSDVAEGFITGFRDALLYPRSRSDAGDLASAAPAMRSADVARLSS
jgi:hypothetical protein